MRLPPWAWRFFAVRWGDETYVPTVLTFGWAPAPRQFSSLLAAVWQPVRAHGGRLLFMLDDCGEAAHSMAVAQHRTAAEWTGLHCQRVQVPVDASTQSESPRLSAGHHDDAHEAAGG